jgi:hypothetical protein
VHICNHSKRLRQEDSDFEVSLGYLKGFCVKKKKKKKDVCFPKLIYEVIVEIKILTKILKT